MNVLLNLALITFLAVFTVYFGIQIFAFIRNTSLVGRTVDLERAVLRSRIDQIMDARRFERDKNEFSWNGFRKFTVSRKVDEGGNTCSLFLTPHDLKPLPPFRPGQYLTFQIQMPDPVEYPSRLRGAIKPVIRCYSLSDGPNQPRYYRVTVKKILPPKDEPNRAPGLVSSYFYDRVKEGDIFDIKAPMGKFCLDMNKQTPIVLMGGGIGVTPVMSMLNAVVASGSKREVWFFYGVRNGSEHMMKDHFKKIATDHENVHVNICYSNPRPEDPREDYHYAERVSIDLFKRILPSNNFEFFVCGPPPMMTQITSELKEWGVPRQKIFFEAFGPSTVKKLTPKTKTAEADEVEEGFEVKFAISNKTCTWKKGSGTLLELAEANMVNIDSGCRAGNCGTCLTAVVSGAVDYLVEHGAQPESGSCLTCISIPRTNVVIDA